MERRRPMHLARKRAALKKDGLDPLEGARSADVCDPLLVLRLGGGSWLSGKLKH